MVPGWKVAVVGATGLVGREMVRVLDERKFPVADLSLFAGERSSGEQLDFAGRPHPVALCDASRLAGFDLVLFATGAEVARQLAPAAVAGGARVVDNSEAFRLDPAVPLVVPEVNGAELDAAAGAGIVANPNCVVIQLALAVAPLAAAASLSRLVVSTYQAVSGRGQAGMEELGGQVTALWRQRDAATDVFGARIAFNLLAQIGERDGAGHAHEEAKLALEMRRVLAAPHLPVVATCVRVPVFNGHAASVLCDFAGPLAPDEARACLARAPGIELEAENSALPPGPADANGRDVALVGRLRAVAPDSLALWCVADNVRKGAAVNAVQIAERLLRATGQARRAV